MLKRLHLKNFTVFADADFKFGPGLNVLVGTNGTGKSHVLKLGYAVVKAIMEIEQHRIKLSITQRFIPITIVNYIANNLVSTFLSAARGQLVRDGNTDDATIFVEFNSGDEVSFEFQIKRPDETALVHNTNFQIKEIVFPVLIPAKEILTLSWMLAAADQLVLPIEQSYLDLLKQLRGLPRRHLTPPAEIQALTTAISGEVIEESGKYYLVHKSGQRLEMSMVAEGLRKFGTLQKLLTNGSLTQNTTLYWDEPEANLNPALLRKLAAILAELARQGFQIILATHSTDLLKEFHILSRQKDAKPLPIKYFGLNAEPGEATRIVSTDNFEHLPDVVALEVELKQADELENIFIREDREYYANHPGEEHGI
ncbi:AAA family ATPase [Hymenobacter arcticus]